MTDDLPDITIRPASAAQVMDLRHAVLRTGLARETAVFDGDDAPTTRHFVAELENRVIGCVTLVLNEWERKAAWQLRGMAVDPALQGRGVGRRLLQAAESCVLTTGTKQLWCNARTPAVPFYERYGWAVVSDEFDIPTAGPHRKMTKSFAD